MAYCDGTCEHLNCKKHICKKTGENLSYCKTTFGVIHEHNGYLECDNLEDRENDTKTIC